MKMPRIAPDSAEISFELEPVSIITNKTHSSNAFYSKSCNIVHNGSSCPRTMPNIDNLMRNFASFQRNFAENRIYFEIFVKKKIAEYCNFHGFKTMEEIFKFF